MGIFRIDEGIGKPDGILSRAAPCLTASTDRVTMRRDIAVCIGERCVVGLEKKAIGGAVHSRIRKLPLASSLSECLGLQVKSSLASSSSSKSKRESEERSGRMAVDGGIWKSGRSIEQHLFVVESLDLGVAVPIRSI